MNKINWCLNVKNGIEKIEPNKNLAAGYILKAEEALETSILAKSKDWKISAAYYTIYFSLYSLLMRAGIKCEIHSCTIEFAKQFLKEILSEDDLEILDDAFKARNDAQYYLNKDVPDKTYERLLKKAPEFLVKCKNAKLEENAVKKIRKALDDHTSKD